MPRIKVNVDKGELERVIQEVEKDGPLQNRNELHEAVARTDWAKNHEPKPLTASVIYLRIDEFGIEPKTPKGRKRSSGPRNNGTTHSASPSGQTRARTKKEKMANPLAVGIYDRIAEQAPQSFQKTIKRARKGSLAAAVRLHCAQCVGFEGVAANVRACSATDCALWPHRPYQQVTVNGELNDDAIEDGHSDDED